MILGVMSAVPARTQAMSMYQTAVHPPSSWSGPMAIKPKAAVMEPVPLMIAVTVPSERVLPPIEGCSARSAATAEVMMLLDHPQGCP